GFALVALSRPVRATISRSFFSPDGTISSSKLGMPTLARWAAIAAPITPAPSTATLRIRYDFVLLMTVTTFRSILLFSDRHQHSVWRCRTVCRMARIDSIKTTHYDQAIASEKYRSLQNEE